MKWGMTNLISPKAVCQVHGDIARRGGEIKKVQLVFVETAPTIVGSNEATVTAEWYRVFYSIPDEKTNGEAGAAGSVKVEDSAVPGSQPGGVEGGQ